MFLGVFPGEGSQGGIYGNHRWERFAAEYRNCIDKNARSWSARAEGHRNGPSQSKRLIDWSMLLNCLPMPVFCHRRLFPSSKYHFLPVQRSKKSTCTSRRQPHRQLFRGSAERLVLFKTFRSATTGSSTVLTAFDICVAFRRQSRSLLRRDRISTSCSGCHHL